MSTETLHAYGILDTLPEPDFDDFVLLASELIGVPISMISLIDGDRQWFKARIGIAAPETPIEQSFCAFAVNDRATLVVPDATQDGRFATMANVTGDPNIRFYAGAPLINPEGVALGTICVIDRVPRTLGAKEQAALEALGRQVVAHLELRRSRLHLEEVDRLRDDALALVAHELRNPVHSIMAFSELLLDETDEPLTAWQRTGLESIAHSGRRLASIAEDLLLLRQLETADLPVEPVTTDLVRLVARAVTAASPVAAAATVALTVVGPAELPLRADPQRIGQVLDNLIGNAVKFTPAGGSVTVTAGVHRSGAARVTVADTGCGIAAEDIPHLFRPFYRVQSARRAGTPGAGLGLAIAKAIAEQHQGTLTVESTPGECTAFTLELPLLPPL